MFFKKILLCGAMLSLACAFTSCDKNEEIFEAPQVTNQVNEEKEPPISELRSWNDSYSYTSNHALKNIVSLAESSPKLEKSLSFTLPANTVWCIKLPDDIRTNYTYYAFFVRFETKNNPSGARLYLDRTRNIRLSDDDTDIDEKVLTFNPKNLSSFIETNSNGSQMESSFDPSYQWIRIKNKSSNPLFLKATFRFAGKVN